MRVEREHADRVLPVDLSVAQEWEGSMPPWHEASRGSPRLSTEASAPTVPPRFAASGRVTKMAIGVLIVGNPWSPVRVDGQRTEQSNELDARSKAKFLERSPEYS
jgi:hypothetical protein